MIKETLQTELIYAYLILLNLFETANLVHHSVILKHLTEAEQETMRKSMYIRFIKE